MIIALIDGAVSGLHVFYIAIAHHFGNQSQIDLYENVVRGIFDFIFIF